MNSLPVLAPVVVDCWNKIGVRGDRSCPELPRVVHCHNCSVFENAGRRFLDAPAPEGYREEWTKRLAAPIEEQASDLMGVLIFRLGEEWLALPVDVLIEVTPRRPIHRVPHRGGVIEGLVNIRGELYLSAHLDQVLGLKDVDPDRPAPRSGKSLERLLVVERDGERWVFPVDEVDQVGRYPLRDLTGVPATVGRSLARMSRGVIHVKGRAIGLLDDERLFQTLRARMR